MSDNKFVARQVNEFEMKPIGNMDIWCEDVSDGYHTFSELYDHRRALTAALLNTLHVTKYATVGKAKLHSDGSMFDGYFVVFIQSVVYDLPTTVISYHYSLKHWEEFKIPEFDKAPEYDGHASSDVINRLLSFI